VVEYSVPVGEGVPVVVVDGMPVGNGVPVDEGAPVGEVVPVGDGVPVLVRVVPVVVLVTATHAIIPIVTYTWNEQV
jgi:hypothetical protein